MSAPTGSAVLIVDDNLVDRERVCRLLGGGFPFLEAATVEEGIHLASTRDVGCVLLDYRMPDRDGDDAVGDFLDLKLPVVMMTAQGNESVAVRVMKCGAQDYLVKADMESQGLRRVVRQAFERRRLEQQLAEKGSALAESDRRLGFALRRLPVIAWTVDRNGRVTSLAGASLPLVYDQSPREALGSSIDELTDPLRELLDVPIEVETKDTVTLRNGRIFRRHVAPTEGEVIGVAFDVTEAKTLEARLRHSAKMESLGKLAGGVAHDFNNVLTAIMTFASFAREALNEDQVAIREDIDEVLEGSRRAAGLVRQLLAFARSSVTTSGPIDMRATVKATHPMLQRVIGEDVRLLFELDEDAWQITLDETRVEQIVVNLVVNARDAMLPRGGDILVELRNMHLSQTLRTRRSDSLPPGDYVVLTISDQGPGIDPNVIDRVFEPFFTTKEDKGGTGLGLSTVYGIAQQAGGIVTVYSQLGRGTTFRVYLPRRPNGEAHEATEVEAPPLRGAGERVLVVEDDAQVGRALERALMEFGYAVTLVDRAEGALENLTAQEFALVLTDVVMPGSDGFTLAEQIRAVHPDVPVVLMSGYTQSALRLRQERETLDTLMVEKPVDPQTLGQMIARMISERAE